jgi:glutathione S-transferase
MSEFTLWGMAGSPLVRAAAMMLVEKSADWRFVLVPAAELRSADNLARHPFGRAPSFAHGDFALYETHAILRYLDAVLPAPALQPADPRARARMDQVMAMHDWYVFPSAVGGIGFQRVAAPVLGLSTDEAAIAAALPKACLAMREIARLKGGAPYLAGDAISLADILLAPGLALVASTPEAEALFEGTDLPDWLARMAARASMTATTRAALMAR